MTSEWLQCSPGLPKAGVCPAAGIPVEQMVNGPVCCPRGSCDCRLSKAEQDMDLCKTWDARILQTCEFLMTLKSRKVPEIEVHKFII